jgi:putative FmdB family regulatory protein
MPIYEYECGNCRHRFEVKQGFKDKPEAVCPQCQQAARRVFHPTPIIFKGKGFYVTDHRPSRKDGEGKATQTETKPDKGKSEASQNTK